MADAQQMEFPQTHMDLFYREELHRDPEAKAKIEAFRKYHEENPQVFELLKKRALQMKERGRKKYGINGLCEVVRWHVNLETRGDEFKLNNNHRPFYSRLLTALVPELKNFFNQRNAVADKMKEAKK